MGYNVFYFEMKLPNGASAQLLDLMDYISNSFLMPFISLLTCIFVGWIIRPMWICEEMEASGHTFKRKNVCLYDPVCDLRSSWLCCFTVCRCI